MGTKNNLSKRGKRDARFPVSAVTVNWNAGGIILRCLESIRNSVGFSPLMVVVDNGSSDHSPDKIHEAFPEAVILRNAINEGYAMATNQGIRYALGAGAEYVLLLDSDAYLADNCISMLHRVAEGHHDAGIISPRICDARQEDVIWYDGGTVNRWGDTVHRNMGRLASGLDKQNKEAVHSIDFATGCCMLIRSTILQSIGLFDENFFAYGEDADLSFRCRDGGFNILHEERALVWHYQSEATKKNRGKWFRDYYTTRNRFYLMRKRLRGEKWLTFLSYALIRHILIPIFYHALTGRGKRCMAVFRGMRDFVLNKSGKVYA